MFSPLVAADRRSELFFWSVQFQSGKSSSECKMVGAQSYCHLARTFYTIHRAGARVHFICHMYYVVCFWTDDTLLVLTPYFNCFWLTLPLASLSLSPLSDKTQHRCQIIVYPPRIVVSVSRDYRNDST
jgi:hypothetical protein